MPARDAADVDVKFLALVFVLPAFAIAYADNGRYDDADVEVEVVTGDNINTVEGDDSLAFGFSHSLGDVDINECIASKAWGSILLSHQYLVVNLWCMAEVYDQKGLHDMAALMRCDISEIRTHFSSDRECRKANTVVDTSDKPATTETDVASLYSRAAQFDKRMDEDEERNRQYAADLAALNERLDKEATTRRASARKYETAQQETRNFNAEFLEKFNELARQETEQPAQSEEPAANDQ